MEMPLDTLDVWAVVCTSLGRLTHLAFQRLLKGSGWKKFCLVTSKHGECLEGSGLLDRC